MTSKTTYYCDCCGKAFDNERECEKHEFSERYAARQNDLLMWNDKWQKLSLSTPACDIYFFYAETDEAFDFVEKQHREFGCDSVREDCGCTGAGHYFYDGMWYKLEDCEKYLKEIRRKFENN